MYIESFKLITGDTRSEDNKAHIISSIDRSTYMTQALLKFTHTYMKSIKAKKGTKNAFLYPAGPVVHHSDGRNIGNLLSYSEIAIKSQAGLSLFTLAKRFPGIDFDYASINGNTCASSLHSLHEAYDLIHNKNYDNVIIYAQDLVEKSQLLLFKQLGINIVCGDGVAAMHLTKEKTDNSIAEVLDTSWIFNNADTSPMSVSRDGYIKTLSELNLGNVDYVKPHGTGTGRNDIEEEQAIQELFGDIKKFYYKKDIGHTQGASAIIETCLVLDEMSSNETAVVIASGLGGFYGSAYIRKI